MASVITGFNASELQKLINQMNDLGQVGKKIGRTSILEASKIVLEQQKQDAPKDSGNSADHLAISKKLRNYRNGSIYADIGITGENWDKCKGLDISLFI